MKLRTQGFFKELIHGNETSPSIFEFIQNSSSVDEEKIIDYLNDGIVIVACGGVVTDVINPNNGISGCPELKTDGVWIWPGDLAYYVKNYHLKIDEEFIKNMQENSWHIENRLDLDFDNIELV